MDFLDDCLKEYIGFRVCGSGLFLEPKFFNTECRILNEEYRSQGVGLGT